MIRVAAPTCGPVIVPLTAMYRAGFPVSGPRTACGRLCVAKLASAAPSAEVISTVSAMVPSSSRAAFIRRARKDPRTITALPGWSHRADHCPSGKITGNSGR